MDLISKSLILNEDDDPVFDEPGVGEDTGEKETGLDTDEEDEEKGADLDVTEDDAFEDEKDY